MAPPISLKIVLDHGAVTRKILFKSTDTVSKAYDIIREKLPTGGDGKDYGLFLTSADNPNSGIWLEGYRTLEYYMLRDGDSLEYLSRTRNLRVRMLDGAIKTLQVDEMKNVGDLMMIICDKIGLANYDEYGLCYEEEIVEVKDKPATGTLTLRKKHKDRDVKMEELSKKLKTDDNVIWLDQHKTLREIGVEANATLLLKRRLFYSDRNIDSRDPVQLNLLYIQVRDKILDGTHPVTEDQALEFAAIQCQVQYGDFNEEKHKPGLIENLSEYLPVAYASSRGVEKKILKLFRNHQGQSQLEAKFLYIKTARALPTYGVTFFLVKEKQKDKKKLVHRLLGINCESVLRLDEVTKEILQVWPLTQVCTYHAGSNDTFSLNFGDYSDKEYCCKTNDAHRIRDILEGYIDIIRKRMLQPHNVNMSDGGGILHETVNMSRGNIVTHVSHQASKITEHNIVGPSRIIEFEGGSQASQGTQMMTVSQIIVTNKGVTSQQGVPLEVPMRHDLSQQFVRKLNRMNSNSLKIVNLMASGGECDVKEARRVIEEMKNELPEIQRGVQENISNQDNADLQRQMEKELKELRDYLDALSSAADRSKMSPEEVEEYAKKIANLSAQMCFLLDPKNRRRSELLQQSRKSFIADEKVDKKLRKASLIVASDIAKGNIDNAKRLITKGYNGPPLSDDQIKQLENSAVDKLGGLNAAVALYLNAYSDPKNIDYTAAINSVNTINELIPELINDVNALSSVSNGFNRDELLCELSAFCDSAASICSFLDNDDPLAKEKLQGAAAGFGDSSGKLIYMFGRRNKKVDADQENEIIDLSKDVGDATTQLLMKVNELSVMIPDPDAAVVDEAGVRTADHTRRLLATAQLTAPSIFDRHCQSALTATIEHLSSSLHKLTDAWSPLVLVHDRRNIGTELKTCSGDVERALERLRQALGKVHDHGNNEEDLQQGDDIANSQRLKFIRGLKNVKDTLNNASNILDEPLSNVQLTSEEVQGLEEGISSKMAEVNSIVATLLNNRTDANSNPKTGEAALNRIMELMPFIVNDTKNLSATCNDLEARQKIISDIQQWCHSIADICACLPENDNKELEMCAEKFGKASKKLAFVFNPRANAAKERLLLELSNAAHQRALQMADNGHKMAANIPGNTGNVLNEKAKNVEEKANNLRTSIMLTAPSANDPHCQTLIRSSADGLSESAKNLLTSVQSLQDNETGCSVLEAKINGQKEDMVKSHDFLKNDLEGIKELCGKQDSEGRRLKFVRSAAKLKGEVTAAQNLLRAPIRPVNLTDEDQQKLQLTLTDDIAKVNAAVASLLGNNDDQDCQFWVANDALGVISELLPTIVKDSKSLVTVCSPEDQKSTLDQVHKWCEDIMKVLEDAERNDVQALDMSAQKFGNTANKLSFVFSPPRNPTKEEQVLQLTKIAADKAKQMLEECQRAADTQPGAAWLRARAGLSAGARRLCATAQLVAPTLHQSECRGALSRAARGLGAASRGLVHHTSLMPQEYQGLSQQLKKHHELLDKALMDIVDICNAKQVKPPVPTRSKSTNKPTGKPTAPHTATVVKPMTHNTNAKQISNDFLHQLRCEESQNDTSKQDKVIAKNAEELKAKENIKALLERKAKEREDDKREEEKKLALKKLEEKKMAQIQDFAKRLEHVDKEINLAEKTMKENYNKPPSPCLNECQIEDAKKKMEERLALASAAAADIIASNKPETIDYVTLNAATEKLQLLMPQIAKEAIPLANSSTEKSRRALLDEILALCEATRRLCHTANTDRAKLSDAAVTFGDKSARLLYMISTDVDPGQEKDVISTAKTIGDSASRLSLQGATLPASAPAAHALCEGGRNTAHAAGTMLYVAKLVAPSIHHPTSQKALISSSADLSSSLAEFRSTFEPLKSHPDHQKTVKEMLGEADGLEKLLEGFRQDLSSGKLVKRKPIEVAIVEDTGLRQLSMKILEDAKNRAESVHLSEEKRKCYASYANKLAEAIKLMDLASQKYRKDPNDINNINRLENAVENVQVTLLQSRHELDNTPQNNIVDLTDYLREVTNNAEELTKQANAVIVKNGKPAVETIKENCNKINLEGFKLVHPTSRQDGDSVDEILEVDLYGADCDGKIQEISSLIRGLQEKDAKAALEEKNMPLVESCNLLRFASKSALTSAKSAALDETFNDLVDLEKRLDTIILPVDGAVTNKTSPPVLASRPPLVSCVSALSRASPALTPALYSYIADQRKVLNLNDQTKRNQLKGHLVKVLDQLKQLTNASRVKHMTWATDSADEVMYTEQVIQELENPSNGLNSEIGKPKANVLNEAQVNRLLMPVDGVTIDGTPEQKEEKLQQTSTKLATLSGTILLSSSKPESLSRSVSTSLSAALQLAGIANGLHKEDPIRSKKIEEASQGMCYATYNLIKTSELVSQDPNNANLRRQLLDACRALNDAINKLVRTASTSNKLNRDCNEMRRTVQTQVNLLQCDHPSSAMPFHECLDALHAQHDVIQKLSSDESLPREEFSKSLGYITDAVCNSTQYATQCAYLVSISPGNKEMAKSGLPDVRRLRKVAAAAQDTTLRILRTLQVEQVKEEESSLTKQIEELKSVIKESASKSKGEVKKELTECGFRIDAAAKSLIDQVHEKNAGKPKIDTSALALLDCLGVLTSVTERPTLVPKAENITEETKAMVEEVLEDSKALLSKTQVLVNEVKASDEEMDPMTWTIFNNGRNGVLTAFDKLVNRLKNHGRRVGIIETLKEETDQELQGPKKTYIQTQVDTAKKWLHRRPSREEVQTNGVKAVDNIINIAIQLSEDLKEQEKKELHQLIAEMKELSAQCSKKYDNDAANALTERVRELEKTIERIVVTRVVEDFLESDSPMSDFEMFLDAERDPSKRNLLLEKKIAELMSQLGRVKRTALLVCDTSGDSDEIAKCTQQVDLLAPLLVKAAQERVHRSEDASVVQRYTELLAQYSAAMSQVRHLCDTSVDPMEFVQTAGESMQRIREESTEHNDPQKCVHSSIVIRRLANRVIEVGMSSTNAQDDPELKKALTDARQKLMQSTPEPNSRQSKMPNWKDVTDELLRTTGEVESVLGGENIFKKQPEPDEPIYNAALGLHASVRQWSGRDNDVVSAARRMAVSMARLAASMQADNQRELIATSKLIVSESNELSRLARKMALECSDIRIRTNLLQVCERILTISGQLKMLTTVKGSSLGRQGSEEDKEAMDMLVGNAQNLMLSVQEVVKAAASASVKIASQRGIRLRWVRKNYY